MDTTTIIVIVVAIVVMMALRFGIRSYRLRRDRGERQNGSGTTAATDVAARGVTGNGPSAVDAGVEPPLEPPPPQPPPAIGHLTPPQTKTGPELAIEASRLHKSFGGRTVVRDVSFAVARGEVFGLVGPNGAGKTTTIRMLMDIIRPDSGEIRLFGQPMAEDAKNRVGYLPEERGLYRRMKVSDTLVYLSSLKGMEARAAKKRAEELLSQVEMLPHQGKKVSELSRGMGQIIQFLLTIAHEPDLLVLDEPFSGLDPVNRQLLKNIILGLKERGKTIILSTHMMNEVEEMCDRIMMIDHGRVVLYGDLAEIKWRYRNNSVLIESDDNVGELEGVSSKKTRGRHVELFLDGDTPPHNILTQLVAKNIRVNRFEVATPSLNDIFIQVVQSSR